MITKAVAVIGTFGLSFSSIFVRFSDTDSIVLAFYRMLFASALLAPVIMIRHREEYKTLQPLQILLCGASGIFFGMHLRFAFLSFATTSIAAATVLVNTEVFFVAIGCRLFQNQKISKWQAAGMLIAFAGSVVIAAGDAGGSAAGLTGDMFALLGALCSAGYTLIGKSIRKSISTTAYTGIAYPVAMITLGLNMVVTRVPFTGFSPYNYLLALGLTLFTTFLGHSIFSWCLKYESAAYVSLVKLLEPVFATGMGILFFREIPPASTVAGGIIVSAGIILYIIFDKKS